MLRKKLFILAAMKQHHYNIKMEWKGNLGTGTQDYQSYSRDHEINFAGKQIVIPGSSDPSFQGDATRYNPEELLVASLSSCHMLWYLHLCAVSKINVLAYVDNAEGVMEETKDGSGRIIGVTLFPKITIANKTDDVVILAQKLHLQAHKMCFIANSVNFDVTVEGAVE